MLSKETVKDFILVNNGQGWVGIRDPVDGEIYVDISGLALRLGYSGGQSLKGMIVREWRDSGVMNGLREMNLKNVGGEEVGVEFGGRMVDMFNRRFPGLVVDQKARKVFFLSFQDALAVCGMTNKVGANAVLKELRGFCAGKVVTRVVALMPISEVTASVGASQLDLVRETMMVSQSLFGEGDSDERLEEGQHFAYQVTEGEKELHPLLWCVCDGRLCVDTRAKEVSVRFCFRPLIDRATLASREPEANVISFHRGPRMDEHKQEAGDALPQPEIWLDENGVALVNLTELRLWLKSMLGKNYNPFPNSVGQRRTCGDDYLWVATESTVEFILNPIPEGEARARIQAMREDMIRMQMDADLNRVFGGEAVVEKPSTAPQGVLECEEVEVDLVDLAAETPVEPIPRGDVRWMEVASFIKQGGLPGVEQGMVANLILTCLENYTGQDLTPARPKIGERFYSCSEIAAEASISEQRCGLLLAQYKNTKDHAFILGRKRGKAKRQGFGSCIFVHVYSQSVKEQIVQEARKYRKEGK